MKATLLSSVLFFITATFCSAQSFSITDSLIAFYQFNGNTLDSTSNHNDGIFNDSTYTTDRFGNPNGAISMNGTTDYVDIKPGKNFKPTTFPISVCAWVKFIGITDTNDGQRAGLVFMNDLPLGVYEGVLFNIVGANNQVAIGFGDGTPIGPSGRETKIGNSNVGDGKWHFIAGVIRGALDMDIYVDCRNDSGTYSGFGGALSYDSLDGSSGRSDPCATGCDPYVYYYGAIDEIRFYHRELSYNDILDLYKISPFTFPSVSLGPNQKLCLPGSVVLSPVSESGVSAYLWSTGSTDSSIIVTDTGTYSLTVSNLGGCYVSDSVTITNGIRVSAGNNTSICPGSSTVLNGSGGTSYSWSPSTGLSSSTIADPIAAPTATTTYTLTASNSLCSGKDSVVVTMGSFTASIMPADTTLCKGRSTQLNVRAAGATTVTWQPATGLSNAIIPDPIASPATSTTYTATISNSSGCTATATVAINVSMPFVAGLVSSDPDTICPSTLATLKLTGNSAGAIQWQSSSSSIGGYTTISGASKTSYTSIPTGSTYYRAIVGTGDCADTSAPFKITILPAPSAGFTASINGHVVAFTSTTSPGIIAYYWNFGDTESDTSANPLHTYSKVDTFDVCLTVKNKTDCNYTICQNIVTYPTGINEIAGDNNWLIYPNPSSGKLFISLGGTLPEGIKVELFDMLGRRVYVANEVNSKPIQIDLYSLATGAYFVRIISAKGDFVKKVNKE